MVCSTWKDAKLKLRSLGDLSSTQKGRLTALLLDKEESERLEYFDFEDDDQLLACLEGLLGTGTHQRHILSSASKVFASVTLIFKQLVGSVKCNFSAPSLCF